METKVPVVFQPIQKVSKSQGARYAVQGPNGDILGYAARPGVVDYDHNGRVQVPVVTRNYELVEGRDESWKA